jgi:hypothetical protein
MRGGPVVNVALFLSPRLRGLPPCRQTECFEQCGQPYDWPLLASRKRGARSLPSSAKVER